MGKAKNADTLALNKGDQKKVVKQTRKLKKKIKDGKIAIKRYNKPRINSAQNRGLVYIGHIPHGFYEDEMKNYFKQFGMITNVKVCRSKKNGNSKGYGYVEFLHAEVAKIAAETMNNYLMFKKRIVAEYVPYEKRPKRLFQGKASTPSRYSSKIRREKQIAANLAVDQNRQLIRAKSRLSNLLNKMTKLKNAGIDNGFEPIDLPNGIKLEQDSEAEATHTYQSDPYDSDIEIKIPLKKSKKSVKSAVSKASTKKSSRKSKSPDTSPSSKILLAKSLDSVKALLSSKVSSKSSNLKSTKSLKKVNKATSVPKFKRNKRNVDKPKGITKKSKKPQPLDADTVKKIARELIRRRGNSLLNVITAPKRRRSNKKKAPVE